MYALVIVLVASARLLPHPPDFTPVGALGLFAGARASGKYAWLVPVAALLVSDALIGFYSPVVMACVYGGFAVTAGLGGVLLRRRQSAVRVGLGALVGSLAFFTLSNFGCWLAGMYPHTLGGLARCYVMALPFYRNSLLGDLIWSAALFGTYDVAGAWAARRHASRARL